MKKNNLLVVGFVVLLIGFIIFSLSKDETNRDAWVICNFVPDYENYDETLKFHYINNVLTEYYRNEVFTEGKDIGLDEIYKGMKEIANQTNDHEEKGYFEYDAVKEDDKVIVNTFILVTAYKEDFDDYAGGLNVNSSYDPAKMKKELELTNYICRIE